MTDPNILTADQRVMLAVFNQLPGPQPLVNALVVLNPVQGGRKPPRRLFSARTPWSDRNRKLIRTAGRLTRRGLLALTPSGQLAPLDKYEITDAGRAVLATAQPPTPNGQEKS